MIKPVLSDIGNERFCVTPWYSKSLNLPSGGTNESIPSRIHLLYLRSHQLRPKRTLIREMSRCRARALKSRSTSRGAETDRIQGWKEQSDMTLGLWNVRMRSGFPDSLELQLTIPQTSFVRTFPRLSHISTCTPQLESHLAGDGTDLSTIASSDSEMSK
jgi:hypothetical protein